MTHLTCSYEGCERARSSRTSLLCKRHYDKERLANMPTAHVVYALHIAGQYFYVGASNISARSRLLNHLQRARRGHRSPVYEYIRTKGADIVEVLELERTATKEELPSREAFWIQNLIEAGYPIVNERSRDGVVNSMSATAGRHISQSKKGRPTWIKGKTGEDAGWTPERRAKLAEEVKTRRATRVPRHGTVNEYVAYKCRCPECVECARAKQRAYLREVAERSKRGEVSPQRQAWLDSRVPRHGTTTEYTNYKCRCPECVKAFSINRKKKH